jgi:hypothetical protein
MRVICNNMTNIRVQAPKHSDNPLNADFYFLKTIYYNF